MNASPSIKLAGISAAFTVLSFFNLTLPLAAAGLWHAWREAGRRGLGIAWAGALIIHLLFPLAPPRMMDGFVDTMAKFGPSIYPDNPLEGAANQIAAMPSLHFAWAMIVAIAFCFMVFVGLRGQKTAFKRSYARWPIFIHKKCQVMLTLSSPLKRNGREFKSPLMHSFPSRQKII